MRLTHYIYGFGQEKITELVKWSLRELIPYTTIERSGLPYNEQDPPAVTIDKILAYLTRSGFVVEWNEYIFTIYKPEPPQKQQPPTYTLTGRFTPNA